MEVRFDNSRVLAQLLHLIGGVMLADTGRDQLAGRVDPALRDVVDELTPEPATVSWFPYVGAGVGEARSAPMMITRIRDENGRLRGAVIVGKPTAGMSTLIGMAHARDVPHLERMERLSRAGRRSAAILFADLEGSSSLSRRLSTARYFSLGRRLVRAARVPRRRVSGRRVTGKAGLHHSTALRSRRLL